MAMENGPFEDVFPIENGYIFHCYVSLPEGRCLWKFKRTMIHCTVFWVQKPQGIDVYIPYLWHPASGKSWHTNQKILFLGNLRFLGVFRVFGPRTTGRLNSRTIFFEESRIFFRRPREAASAGGCRETHATPSTFSADWCPFRVFFFQL